MYAPGRLRLPCYLPIDTRQLFVMFGCPLFDVELFTHLGHIYHRFPLGDPDLLGQNLIFTEVHINQDLIWCVKIGLYMGFCVHRGS